MSYCLPAYLLTARPQVIIYLDNQTHQLEQRLAEAEASNVQLRAALDHLRRQEADKEPGPPQVQGLPSLPLVTMSYHPYPPPCVQPQRGAAVESEETHLTQKVLYWGRGGVRKLGDAMNGGGGQKHRTVL